MGRASLLDVPRERSLGVRAVRRLRCRRAPASTAPTVRAPAEAAPARSGNGRLLSGRRGKAPESPEAAERERAERHARLAELEALVGHIYGPGAAESHRPVVELQARAERCAQCSVPFANGAVIYRRRERTLERAQRRQRPGVAVLRRPPLYAAGRPPRPRRARGLLLQELPLLRQFVGRTGTVSGLWKARVASGGGGVAAKLLATR